MASIETFWQNSDRQNSEMLLRIHVQLIAIDFALNLDSYKTCEIYLINNNLKNVIIFFHFLNFENLLILTTTTLSDAAGSLQPILLLKFNKFV